MSYKNVLVVDVSENGKFVSVKGLIFYRYIENLNKNYYN